MTQTPTVGRFLSYFHGEGAKPIPALVTHVREVDRGEHIVPELRHVTALTLTLFTTDDTIEGKYATFGEEFDKLPSDHCFPPGRAFWPVFE